MPFVLLQVTVLREVGTRRSGSWNSEPFKESIPLPLPLPQGAYCIYVFIFCACTFCLCEYVCIAHAVHEKDGLKPGCFRLDWIWWFPSSATLCMQYNCRWSCACTCVSGNYVSTQRRVYERRWYKRRVYTTKNMVATRCRYHWLIQSPRKSRLAIMHRHVPLVTPYAPSPPPPSPSSLLMRRTTPPPSPSSRHSIISIIQCHKELSYQIRPDHGSWLPTEAWKRTCLIPHDHHLARSCSSISVPFL